MSRNKYLAATSVACTIVGAAAGVSGVVSACMLDLNASMAQMVACLCLMWLAIDAAHGFQRAKKEDTK